MGKYGANIKEIKTRQASFDEVQRSAMRVGRIEAHVLARNAISDPADFVPLSTDFG
jgi:hypothetical protein